MDLLSSYDDAGEGEGSPAAPGQQAATNITLPASLPNPFAPTAAPAGLPNPLAPASGIVASASGYALATSLPQAGL